MALTLEDALLTKQRALNNFNYTDPECEATIRQLFDGAINAKGSPKLQYVSIDYTGNVDIVVADVACRLYAVVLKKPTASTVDAWAKFSDHATVASADPDLAIKLVGTGGGGRQYALTFQNGLSLATGLTTASHTSNSADTDSADADASAGFAIIGAA